MGGAGFWDNQDNAAKVSAEHARVQRRVESFRTLESEVADLDDLAEMAKEDEAMADELEAMLDSIEDRLERLEEERLFSGKYDAGDALVSINAGAGGTDAPGLGRDGAADGAALG